MIQNSSIKSSGVFHHGVKKIYFVRHGITEANIGNREQGPVGPLTELGRKQAEFVAKRLSTLPIDTIVASPQERAKETAEIIASHIKKDITFTETLVERKASTEFIGVHQEDPEYVRVKMLSHEKRMVDPAWRHSDEDNFFDLKNRAVAALKFLEATPGEHIVAVTHAGILRMIVGVVIFGEELTYLEWTKLYFGLTANNTGITIVKLLDVERPHIPGFWKLVSWNDHAHLPD